MPPLLTAAIAMPWRIAAMLTDAAGAMARRATDAEAPVLEAEQARMTLDSIGDAIISTDVAGNVTYLNHVAEGMTGWKFREASGRPLHEVLRIVDGASRARAMDPMEMAIRYDRAFGLGADSVLIGRDGRESAIEDTATPIHDRRGVVTGAVIVFHDVSVARAMSARMSHLAQHDFLTDLPNRMLLRDRLTQAIASAQRHGQSLAVLFLDVDDFKRVNDSLGHGVGDQLLLSIARRLVSSVRASDTVSRQGGDEFVVLLPEVASARDAVFSADKVLAALTRPHRVGGQDLLVTASIGIGVYPDDAMDAETLLEHADIALFRAKRQGRGNHRRFERVIGDSGDDADPATRASS